jgi:hypothetical protein
MINEEMRLKHDLNNTITKIKIIFDMLKDTEDKKFLEKQLKEQTLLLEDLFEKNLKVGL